jgi:hypothetical protein
LIPLLLFMTFALMVIGLAAARGLRSRRAMRFILLLGILAVVLVTSPVTLAWAIWLAADVRCGGPPVAATRFAAANTYDLPGDVNYGPGVFPIILPDYFCTEADAEAHRFHRDPIR